jgi:hypothetical protein
MWFGNMTWCDVMDGWLGVCACSGGVADGNDLGLFFLLLPTHDSPCTRTLLRATPDVTLVGTHTQVSCCNSSSPARPSPTLTHSHSHSRAVTLTDGRMAARRQTRRSCSSGGRPIVHHTSLCGLTRESSLASKIKAVWPRLSRERDPTSTRRGSQTRVRPRLLTTFGIPMLRRVARKHPRCRRPLLG